MFGSGVGLYWEKNHLHIKQKILLLVGLSLFFSPVYLLQESIAMFAEFYRNCTSEVDLGSNNEIAAPDQIVHRPSLYLEFLAACGCTVIFHCTLCFIYLSAVPLQTQNRMDNLSLRYDRLFPVRMFIYAFLGGLFYFFYGVYLTFPFAFFFDGSTPIVVGKVY